MKKLFTLIIGVAFLLGTQTSWAQTHAPEALKEGYAMQEGKMVKIAGGTISPMEADVTLENGTKVQQDGTVILPGKKAQQLKEGYAVNNLGKIVLLEYDMMTYEAIREHSLRMLGNTETQIITNEDGSTVVIGAADATEAEDALEKNNKAMRKSTLLTERSNLVVRKAELMNKLSHKEIPKNEELKGINARLKQVEQELKELEQPAQPRQEPVQQQPDTKQE